MTTIIVVAIVALVFFVTVCVVTFMVWKRETEMRTDSLKGIETSINEVLRELAADNDMPYGRRRFHAGSNNEFYEGYSRSTGRKRKDTDVRKKKNGGDPFSWVRTENNEAFNEDLKVFRPDETQTRKVKWIEVPATEPAEMPPADDSTPPAEPKDEPITEQTPGSAPEINLSFVDLEDIESMDLNEIDFGGIDFFENADNVSTDYNTGRSGKKYTAEELESLIKE